MGRQAEYTYDGNGNLVKRTEIGGTICKGTIVGAVNLRDDARSGLWPGSQHNMHESRQAMDVAIASSPAGPMGDFTALLRAFRTGDEFDFYPYFNALEKLNSFNW